MRRHGLAPRARRDITAAQAAGRFSIAHSEIAVATVAGELLALLWVPTAATRTGSTRPPSTNSAKRSFVFWASLLAKPGDWQRDPFRPPPPGNTPLAHPLPRPKTRRTRLRRAARGRRHQACQRARAEPNDRRPATRHNAHAPSAHAFTSATQAHPLANTDSASIRHAARSQRTEPRQRAGPTGQCDARPNVGRPSAAPLTSLLPSTHITAHSLEFG
jgi:hypothetical protein